MTNGRLIYLVGPSGAGKDTLLRAIREKTNDLGVVIAAHRYITRPSEPDGENHISLSEAEFLRRRELALFALHWKSHGFHYGIGIEIDLWMQQGATVVVNGSRAHLPTAKQRYPDLLGVYVHVDEPILRERLLARGREQASDLESRLRRNQEFERHLESDVHVIDNSGELRSTVERLTAYISSTTSAAMDE